jgi:anaerobic magnesium-protoporphyrin IX monomethyl ester cyclase
LKTLFINPNNRNPMGDMQAIETPLWLLIMASHWMEDGKEVVVCDAEAEDINNFRIIDRIAEVNPDEIVIVCMGNNPSVSSTPKYPKSEVLYNAVKKHYKTYLTGIHPMAVPNASYDVLHWSPTKTLPLHYELLPMDKYRAHNWHCLGETTRSPYASTYTSLGCIFNCYYCNIHTLYKDHSMMYRNLDNVVLEIDKLVYKYGVRHIKLWDELFALKESRVLELCEMIKPYDLNIWAYARVDTVTEKMLKAMKMGGINWISYGFENANAKVREASNKNFKETQVEKAIRMTRDAGINIMANFTFGLPGEDEKSAEDTLRFAKHHLFEFCNFYVALPYPGSQWYNSMKPDMRPQDFDQYNLTSPWRGFRDRAFVEYFRNPEYQEYIEDKFGTSGLKTVTDMLEYRR